MHRRVGFVALLAMVVSGTIPSNAAHASLPPRIATTFQAVTGTVTDVGPRVDCLLWFARGADASAILVTYLEMPDGRRFEQVDVRSVGGGATRIDVDSSRAVVHADLPPNGTYGTEGFPVFGTGIPVALFAPPGTKVVVAWAAWNSLLYCSSTWTPAAQPRDHATIAFAQDFHDGLLASVEPFASGAFVARNRSLIQHHSGFLLGKFSGTAASTGVADVAGDGPEGEHYGNAAEFAFADHTDGDWRWSLNTALSTSTGPVLWTLELPAD